MYRMQNGVVYGPLSKITKLAAIPAVMDDAKEGKAASGVIEDKTSSGVMEDRTSSGVKENNAISSIKQIKNPSIQKGIKKQPSSNRTPATQVPLTQASTAPAPLVEPVYKPESQEAKEHLQRQLREAILLSEILGKPVCRKRKRSYYGD